MLMQLTVGKLLIKGICDTCNTFTEEEDTKGGHAEAVLKSEIQIFIKKQAAVTNRKTSSPSNSLQGQTYREFKQQ